MKRKPTEIVQIGLRLRENLRGQLEAHAKSKAVSLNSEIVSRLEKSLLLEFMLGDNARTSIPEPGHVRRLPERQRR